jgi:hypothetical protein
MMRVVLVQNIGSTTVTYEWKRVHRGDHLASKKSDFVQRFFCHYPRSILKPGESKTFNFSFKSSKIGMFNEEWELLTEPLLLTPLNSVCLSGIACEEDSLAEKREEFWRDFRQTYPNESNPSISELESHVRVKKVEKIDFADKEAVRKVFE